jgi:hypothetical protein
VREATLRQKLYSELFPTCRASLDIARIAKKIDEQSYERSPRGGMQFFFRSLVEGAR